ncbi:Counting factor 60 [Madurella mycetomatis]|uniref:Counting factor 60 n=1 Tax=Madurella mycetomatis TaxID=100816 RepID=A0A175VU11_9PEZI|nr:Counting factor 60 [Madurella mycetomatis]
MASSRQAPRWQLSLPHWACSCVTGIAIFLAVAPLLHLFKPELSAMLARGRQLLLAFAGVGLSQSPADGDGTVDLSWYPPKQTQINNLTAVLTGEGVYGFIYNSSNTPDDRYGAYNWCNMPHVRREEYIRAPPEYELVYVELIHRHHKRTPYSSNAFPAEPYPWNCDDQALYYHGEPIDGHAQKATPAYWKGYTSPANPFTPSGWRGTCQFPQITTEGLSDSWQHGADLYAVYHDLLGFLPPRHGPLWRRKVAFRVTHNSITSQVAGMLVHGMFRGAGAGAGDDRVPLLIQPATVDSLEPRYPCPAAQALFAGLTSPEGNRAWGEHLDAAAGLFGRLDAVSGVPPDDAGFHASFDHYYDNLSARECHRLPLPCTGGSSSDDDSDGGGGGGGGECVTRDMADAVYRMGHWEYSHIYRSEKASLEASVASFGVWIAELAAHLRNAMGDGEGNGGVIYRHNIAHDGSVSRLLSVLQVEEMVWPGMGSEVVFELFRKKGGEEYFVRGLFSGRALRSSSPALGVMDMVPVERVLGYFEGLIGKGAEEVKGRCEGN